MRRLLVLLLLMSVLTAGCALPHSDCAPPLVDAGGSGLVTEEDAEHHMTWPEAVVLAPYYLLMAAGTILVHSNFHYP